jgi:hypothetical protein
MTSTPRIITIALAILAVAVPAASAMPIRDPQTMEPVVIEAQATHATRMHHSAPPGAFVDAAAHAATIRAIGAALAARASG